MTGKSVSHPADQCKGFPSVCIHCGTTGDFEMKWPQGGEVNGVTECKMEQTGWIYSPELCYSVLWLSQREETWTCEK